MKWHEKGNLVYANSDKKQGIVYIVDLKRNQLFIYQGIKQIYYTDSFDEINRFFFEFGYEYYR